MSKTLIAFFSRKGNNYVNGKIINLKKGNTAEAARKLQTAVGGDLFEIQTVHPYSADYQTCTEEAQQELQADARPELADNVADMDQYDTIFLGYPNWWGTMPMAVRTFLESFGLTGKTIRPFCTHEGSGMGHSEQDLKKICPGSKIGKGLAVKGSKVNHADKAIAEWAEQTV